MRKIRNTLPTQEDYCVDIPDKVWTVLAVGILLFFIILVALDQYGISMKDILRTEPPPIQESITNT